MRPIFVSMILLVSCFLNAQTFRKTIAYDTKYAPPAYSTISEIVRNDVDASIAICSILSSPDTFSIILSRVGASGQSMQSRLVQFPARNPSAFGVGELAVTHTSDDGYMVVLNNNLAYSTTILKLDPTLSVMWSREILYLNYNNLHYGAMSINGSFYLIGSSDSTVAPDHKNVIYKITESNGSVVWKNSYLSSTGQFISNRCFLTATSGTSLISATNFANGSSSFLYLFAIDTANGNISSNTGVRMDSAEATNLKFCKGNIFMTTRSNTTQSVCVYHRDFSFQTGFYFYNFNGVVLNIEPCDSDRAFIRKGPKLLLYKGPIYQRGKYMPRHSIYSYLNNTQYVSGDSFYVLTSLSDKTMLAKVDSNFDIGLCATSSLCGRDSIIPFRPMTVAVSLLSATFMHYDTLPHYLNFVVSNVVSSISDTCITKRVPHARFHVDSVCSGSVLKLYGDSTNDLVQHRWIIPSLHVNITTTNDTVRITPSACVDTSVVVYHIVTDDAGCTDSDAHILMIRSCIIRPTLSVTSSTSKMCLGDTALVMASGQYIRYLWNTGDTISAIMALRPGLYSCTAATGCFADSQSIIITRDTSRHLSYPIADTILCTLHRLSYQLPDSLRAVHIRWSSGDTGLVARFAPGMYTLHLDNECTQYNDTFTILYTGTDTINLLPDTHRDLCPGQIDTITAMPGFAHYAWNTGATTSSITVSDSGTYRVYARDMDNCGVWDSIRIIRPPLPTAILDKDTISACVASFPVTVHALSGFSSYRWDGIAGNAIYVVDTPDRMIEVSGTTECGIVKDTLYALAINELTGITWAVDSDCMQNIATVTAIATGSPIISWDNGSRDPVQHVSLPRDMIVRATYSCQVLTDTIHLSACAHFVHHLYVPDAFSPNGDGINDGWEIYGDKVNIKYLSITVYDRWGEPVYSSNDIDFKWDGRYRNSVQPGVFVYTLSIAYQDGKDAEAMGSITIIK